MGRRERLCQAEVLAVLPFAVIAAACLTWRGGLIRHALIVLAFLAPGLIPGRRRRGLCYLAVAGGLALYLVVGTVLILAAPDHLGLWWYLGVLVPCILIYLGLGLGLVYGRLLPRVMAWSVFPLTVAVCPLAGLVFLFALASAFSPLA